MDWIIIIILVFLILTYSKIGLDKLGKYEKDDK